MEICGDTLDELIIKLEDRIKDEYVLTQIKGYICSFPKEISTYSMIYLIRQGRIYKLSKGYIAIIRNTDGKWCMEIRRY